MQTISASAWLRTALASIFAVTLLAGCAKQEAASTDSGGAGVEAVAPEGEASTEAATSSAETPVPPADGESGEAPKQ